MTRRRLCFIVVLIAAGAIHAQLGPNSVQPYEQQLAQPTPLARALNRRYARHLPSLRQEIAAQPRNTPPRLTWLDEQLAPLAKTELVDSGSAAGASGTAGCSLVIRCAGDDIQPGQIAQYTIDFIVLEELAGKSLDRMGITIAALHDDDSGNNAAANAPAALVCQVTPLTPDRIRVAWPIAGAARRFRIDIAPASDHGGALPLQRLLGMGDQLMLNARETTGLPGNIWSAKFAPIFGDGKPALIAGRWTDFAHIFQNLGAPGPFKTAEAHHFLARDSMDEAIGTDEHHGLAFSVVDPADVDGDDGRHGRDAHQERSEHRARHGHTRTEEVVPARDSHQLVCRYVHRHGGLARRRVEGRSQRAEGDDGDHGSDRGRSEGEHHDERPTRERDEQISEDHRPATVPPVDEGSSERPEQTLREDGGY